MDILAATYKKGFELELKFDNDEVRILNFEPILKKYAKGDNAKYLQPINFKKFKIDEGNLVWGKDWDLIFPVQYLFNKSQQSTH